MEAKKFLYRKHYYTIVFKSAGGSKQAKAAVEDLQKHVYSNSRSVIKKTADGRYTLGIR